MKARVPERAMVPRLSISSWRSMPMPVSAIVERACLVVGGDADGERAAVAQQLGLGDGLVAQLVAGIGRVRDQLAQEDVALRVDRMHHQVQQLGHLGLEGMGLANSLGSLGFSAHAACSLRYRRNCRVCRPASAK